MKVVLITGASHGIGREIAKNMSQDSLVVANYNNSQEQADSLKQEVGNNLEIYKADVSKREEVHKMINYIIDTYGKIDVVIIMQE